MGQSIADLISSSAIPPKPRLIDTADRKAWDYAVGTYYIEYCRDHVRSDVYVDSIGGSDSNNGSTPTTPKQTLTAALASLGDNIRIYAKANSVFKNEAVVLDHAGCSLEKYGDGANPLLWGFAPITGTWAQAGASNRWTITVPDTDTAIVVQGDPDDPDDREGIKDRPYQRVFTTADCEATPGTFYQAAASTTLSVHAYGSVNPNTVLLHRRHRTATAPATNGIRITNVDRVYVANIDVMGYGRDIADQAYCIRSEAEGTNVHAIVGCNAHFNPAHHACGHYSGSGGITVWRDGTYGYCTHDSAGNSTIFVDFTTNGGQTLFFHNMLCDGGQLAYASNGAGVNAINRTFSGYIHLGGTPAAKVVYASIGGHTIRTRAGNKISKSFCTDSNAAAPNNPFVIPTNKYDLTGQYDEYTYFIFDEVYDEGLIASGNFVGWNQIPGMVRLDYDWGDLRIAKAGSNGGGILGPCEGLLLQGEASFLFNNAQEAEFFGIFYGGVAPFLTRPGLWWSHWRITWNGDATTGAAGKAFAQAASDKASQVGACVMGYVNTVNGSSATFTRNAFGLAPNQAPGYTGANPTGGQVDNAYYRVNPANYGSWNGYNASTNPLNLTTTSGINVIEFGTHPDSSSPLVGRATNVPSYLKLSHDKDGIPRSQNTVGPYEVEPDGGINAAAFLAIRRRRRSSPFVGGQAP